VPHSKAEHMAAPTNAANVKKVLANSEPSTHGTSRHFSALQNLSLLGNSGQRSILAYDGLSAFDPKRSLAPAPREQEHASDFRLKTALARIVPTQNG
jgi:hypothetical protein